MKNNIVILNVCRYTKDGKDKSLISFFFANEENLSLTDKFKGYADLKVFYDNTNAFDKLPVDVIGKIVSATIEDKSSKFNPMRKSSTITSVEYKGIKYDLF